MDPKLLLLFVLLGVACLAVGYAIRGAIRRELSVAKSEAVDLSSRLEVAARRGADELKDEAQKIVAELRAKL